MELLKPMTALAALAFAGTADAHVAVTPDQAPAGAHQALHFRLGHGCDGKPTTQLRIEIPDGVDLARPQPKPGWTLHLDRVSSRVSAVQWAGRLEPDHSDEFVLLVKLPRGENGAAVAFNAIQTCQDVELRWTKTQQPGQSPPAGPPPSIRLQPPSAAH